MSDSIDMAADDASEQAFDTFDPAKGLLTAVVYRLMPLFVIPGFDAGYAPRAAAEAIESFDPQSRSDIANIGRILALTLASVDTIAQGVTLDLQADERLRFLTKGQGLSASADRTERVMVLRRKQAMAARATDVGDAPPYRQPARPNPERQQPLTPDDPGSALPPVAEHDAVCTPAPAPEPAIPAVMPVTTPVAIPAASIAPRAIPPAFAAPRADASWSSIGASQGLEDPAGFGAVVQRTLAGGAQEPDLDVLLAGLHSLTGTSALLSTTPGRQGGSLRDGPPGRDARSPPRDHTEGL